MADNTYYELILQGAEKTQLDETNARQVVAKLIQKDQTIVFADTHGREWRVVTSAIIALVKYKDMDA